MMTPVEKGLSTTFHRARQRTVDTISSSHVGYAPLTRSQLQDEEVKANALSSVLCFV